MATNGTTDNWDLREGRFSPLLVRFWLKEGSQEMAHGRVTHIESRETRKFRTHEELQAFMRLHEQPSPAVCA